MLPNCLKAFLYTDTTCSYPPMMSNKSMFVVVPYFRLLKITMGERKDTDVLQLGGISISDIEDALIETEVFGNLTLNSMLEGTHYVRSFQGLSVISDVITSLMWEASGCGSSNIVVK